MEEKKKGLPRRKYDGGFKAEALKMVAGGQAVSYVSEALGVGGNLIYRWRQRTEGKEKSASETGTASLSVENQQLK